MALWQPTKAKTTRPTLKRKAKAFYHMGKKVAIYIRVSSLDQAREGYSLAAQERTLRNYCSDKGYSVYELYADEGISGKDMVHRPSVQKLMQDAEERKFDIILFWALSRFTRSVSDLYQTVYKLNQLNIDLVSYTEAFDTSTPFGRAIVGILGVFAQLERELTSERVSFALDEKFKQDRYIPSHLKGYVAKNNKLQVIKKEADCVKLCFDTYLETHSLSETARILNRAGYKGKRGKEFSANSVKVILKNKTYTGYIKFKKEEKSGSHESIISYDTFKKVQKILTQKHNSRKRKNFKQ